MSKSPEYSFGLKTEVQERNNVPGALSYNYRYFTAPNWLLGDRQCRSFCLNLTFMRLLIYFLNYIQHAFQDLASIARKELCSYWRKHYNLASALDRPLIGQTTSQVNNSTLFVGFKDAVNMNFSRNVACYTIAILFVHTTMHGTLWNASISFSQ